MKVAICIPTGRTWEAEMGLSLAALAREVADIDLSLLMQTGSQIAHQRNQLVQGAIDEGADYAFWWDTDMIFPQTALRELLSFRVPIVGAAYCKRVPPYELIGRMTKAEGRLKPAEYLPGGCMLVETAVYKAIPWPWYFEVPIPAEKKFISEDFAFCRKAIQHGYEILCDISLSQRIVHLGTQPVRFALTPDHPDAIQQGANDV